MTKTLSQRRSQDLAQQIRPHLEEGEEFTVYWNEDRVEVAPLTDANLLQQAHPDLLGRLLALDNQISNAGSLLSWFGMSGLALACLTVHLGWVDTVLGQPIEKFQSLWVYALVIVLGFGLLGLVVSRFERAAYQHQRGPLIDAMKDAGLTHYEVLAMIEGSSELKRVAEQMKADASPLPR